MLSTLLVLLLLPLLIATPNVVAWSGFAEPPCGEYDPTVRAGPAAFIIGDAQGWWLGLDQMRGARIVGEVSSHSLTLGRGYLEWAFFDGETKAIMHSGWVKNLPYLNTFDFFSDAKKVCFAVWNPANSQDTILFDYVISSDYGLT